MLSPHVTTFRRHVLNTFFSSLQTTCVQNTFPAKAGTNMLAFVKNEVKPYVKVLVECVIVFFRQGRRKAIGVGHSISAHDVGVISCLW